ncbi:MAG: S8 family serine peptidase [Eubacteriales bacterium]|nr:S8 family serine peptidase [Eubacteriales bacterium]
MYDIKEKHWVSAEPDGAVLQRYREGNLPDDPSTQYLLADWLLTDLSQSGSTVADAVYLMEQAANAGNPDAAFSMGQMFEHGHGVGKNRESALKWYEKAAFLGYPEASGALRNLRSNNRRRKSLVFIASLAVLAAAGLFILVKLTSPSVKSHLVRVHKDTELQETASLTDFSVNLAQLIAENDDSDVINGQRSSNRIILKYEDDSLDLRSFPASTVAADDSGLIAVQFLNNEDAKNCLDSFYENGKILYAMEDRYREYEPDDTPDIKETVNDSRIYPADDVRDYIYSSPYTGLEYYSWGVELMGFDVLGAWLKNVQTEPVVVAVIDTGTVPCDETRDRILEGFSPYNPESKGWDIDSAYLQSYHGTHVAGTILDCTRGLNINILPIRYFNSETEKTLDSSVILSIEYAIEQDVDVINMSFGADLEGMSQTELREHNAVLREAYARGIVLVTSAGNDDYRTEEKWPAYFEDCIVVGAIQSDRKVYERSNHGETVDVCAPGVVIRSNVPLGYYSKEYDTDRDGEIDEIVRYPNAYLADLTGTSMAAPHISALAAMLKLYMPDRTPAQIDQYIKDHCEPLGNPLYYGAGLPIAASFADEDVRTDDTR